MVAEAVRGLGLRKWQGKELGGRELWVLLGLEIIKAKPLCKIRRVWLYHQGNYEKVAETDWDSILTGVSVSTAAANFCERYHAIMGE